MRAKRVDDNQKQIVDSLRKLGHSVAITSMVGFGFPDIVVGNRGRNNFLFEIKDGKKTASQKKLTEDEVKFQSNWKGQYSVVETLDEILEIIK